MKTFNTTAVCIPELHYMVDITGRLAEIKKMVDDGSYFTINRARQYGKTTILKGLVKYLHNDYIVVPLDFQSIGNSSFQSEGSFSRALARIFMDAGEFQNVPIPLKILHQISRLI